MVNIRRHRYLPAIMLALVVLSACGGVFSGSSADAEPPDDFAFVPYQGFESSNAGEGEAEMMFSELFEDGDPVVLNFWAGQCPPCRAEMPHFQRLANEYEGEFTLIGIDVGPFTGLGKHEDAVRLLDELDISYPAGRAVERDPLVDYNVTGMPTTVFFDSGGQIVDTQIGMISEDEMRERIDDLV